MTVEQIATILNETIFPEILGDESLKVENLATLTTKGQDITAALTASGHMDNYVKKLLNRIGREINWTRPYISAAPNLLKDSWEFGSILMKTRAALPEVVENDTWSLTAGTDYSPNVYTPPEVSAHIWNKRTTFEVDCSFAERQVKESFTNAESMAAFFGMIESRINDTITVALDSLIMRTINRMIFERCAVNADINLLAMYNDIFNTELEAANCCFDKDFLRFAAYQILLFKSRLRTMNKQFNPDGYATHSPLERQKLVLLSDFAKGADIYLQSDTYHDELVKVGDYYDVPSWQSTGAGFSWENVSGIKASTGGATADIPGVLGVLFDEQAAAVCCENRRVTTNYNSRGEFYNNFYKVDVENVVDNAENAIVFRAVDTE